MDRNPATSINLCISPTQDGEEFMDERMRCSNDLDGLLPDEVNEIDSIHNS